ncbi:kinesin family member 2/24 [Strigomonas culicis]|uniref:Kinesin-like protein n=1 Tax=Strigomonas culicis TaxID=28005 RepID=S9VN38_9TRYP|nr:kinesin family member 2/24 [Strigomonas culicis]|eukprot:EPY24620.1 kinesin family member 2/24 [Strigomonas culicis]
MHSSLIMNSQWGDKEEVASKIHLHRLSEPPEKLRAECSMDDSALQMLHGGEGALVPTLSSLNRAFAALSSHYEEQSRAPRRANKLLPIKVNEAPSPKPRGHSVNYDTHAEKSDVPVRSLTPPPRPSNGRPTSTGKTDGKSTGSSPRRRSSSVVTPVGANCSASIGSAAAVSKSRDGRIRVVVRKRPLMPQEGGTDCVAAEDGGVTLAVAKQRIDLTEYTDKTTFSFDTVFSEETHNEDIYQSCMEPLLEVAMSGGSASIFAYGQTGSGKTHTMMGSEKERGLYYLSIAELLRRATDGQQFSIAFYEIYCNSLFDLLNGRYPVVLREDANRRMNLCGLLWKPVTCIDDLWTIISSGMDIRSTGSTSANERSSRSHAVMTIRIDASADSKAFPGMLNFVDLAGSERGADTDAKDKITRSGGRRD